MDEEDVPSIVGNMDEVLAQMELEDELDAAREGLTKMTPREFAKAKGIQPQLIYYWLRTGKVQSETCVCGRRVVDVQELEAFLEKRDAAK